MWGPSAWENTNTTYNNYYYGGSDYNSNDQDTAIDNSLFTDHIPLTPPVCTNNTTTVEVDSKLSDLDDLIEFTSLQPDDVIGKKFASIEDAESFYNNYSKFVGFSTRNDEKRHDKQSVITIRRWVCSKQGYRAQKYIDRSDKKREPTCQTREGCHAAFIVHFERNNAVWVAKEFVTQYTHNLVPPNHIHFLRSHRNVQDSEIAQLKSWRSVGVKTAQVMDHHVDQAGSYSNVGHTKKDLQNRFESIRRDELQTSDADCVISYLTAKAVMDPEFFFDYLLDEDDRLGNLFWADSTSRSDYGYFGDVLAFDATYKTNVYRRPLVMLIRVNHHNSTAIFGFGLLGDETIETYTWLLQTFLVSMHGKMPQSVVIDGDRAMHKAIKTVMPDSVRRLCCWHLERNVQTNIQDGNFTRAFYSCMLNFMTAEEFDLRWINMVDNFGLNNNERVNGMYSKRKQWAETFLRDSFFGGMRSTQRCESMNSFLNRFVHCRLKLYEFMQNIDRALDRIRNTESFNDYQCSNTTPVYTTHLLGLEKDVANQYTRNVFFLMRDEMKEEASFSICNCVEDVDSVMKAMNMQNIPSSLILTRWTTGAKDLLDIDYFGDATPTPIMEMARHGSLSSKCSKLCYFASTSNDGFKEAKGEIDKLTVRLQQLMPCSPLTSENVLGMKDKQHVHNVRDPCIAATKGSARRNKKDGGNSRKCGKCRKHGHTVKTCHASPQTNNSRISSNTIPILDPSLIENIDNSFATPSTGPSYSFTFLVNDGGMGSMSQEFQPLT
ncbi:hypothetical protein Dsin_009485 [Dipteronia sinensis]|uniref:Protein FAR1-RELATED SEQUENCE n=1 Tax=Dipteronia sinensis TaxID=43782 RepID=A0AAE0EDI7_9ROSI|nr:hypothetical protein Dsin_009485 [Dipteronia sinensis]